MTSNEMTGNELNPWTSDTSVELSADVLEVLCGFLTGFDAFNLSHTNVWWRSYLSEESFWLKRCQRVGTRDLLGISWRKQYIQSRSMVFRSLKVEEDSNELDAFSLLVYDERFRQRVVNPPPFFQLTHLGVESFTFDVWFSLLPASESEYYGGILLGLQSSSRLSGTWPDYHQQFVMVSSTGDLYCSVLADKSVVASDLQSNRWYHLALTYDNDLQRQEVYLDGNKIRSEIGSRHHEWNHLIQGQIGTGCVTSDILECPRRGHIGWYGFHGVVDAFRVWGQVLPEDEIVHLSDGGELSTLELSACLKREQDVAPQRKLQYNVRIVKCTRPSEGVAMQLVE